MALFYPSDCSRQAFEHIDYMLDILFVDRLFLLVSNTCIRH